MTHDPPSLLALALHDEGKIVLRSPGVGFWRNPPLPGTLLRPNDPIGCLIVLGRRIQLHLPPEAYGRVVAAQGATSATRAVQYTELLLTLDPVSATELFPAAQADTDDHEGASSVLRTRSSGRFYASPAPERAPFVSPGERIERGQTIGLLEVMKTFTRIQFKGPEIPQSATIVQIFASDQTDLEAGDPILEFTIEAPHSTP